VEEIAWSISEIDLETDRIVRIGGETKGTKNEDAEQESAHAKTPAESNRRA
jgi:hypothetical protein